MRLKAAIGAMALCLSGLASAGVEQYFQPAMVDLVAAVRSRGFPAEVSIWAINREMAVRYANRDDGDESLLADCRREVPGDDGSNDAPKSLPMDSMRCAAVANALFDNGALALLDSNEVVVSPLGVGSKMWRGISSAIAQRVGDELALALVTAHEMAHVAWRQHVFPATRAKGCGDDCDSALFYESELEEAFCDFLATWIVAVSHGRPPAELMAALAAGRYTLDDNYDNDWAALAGTLAQARIPGYARMEFAQASDTALEWAMRVPGLKERWTMPGTVFSDKFTPSLRDVDSRRNREAGS